MTTLEDLVSDVAHFYADTLEPVLITYRAAGLGHDLTAPRLAVVSA